MKAFVALISAALLASAALAQSTDGPTGSGAALGADNREIPDNTSTSAEPTADGARRICRRVAISSNSRMSTRRVCRTAAEWREADRSR